MVWSDHLKCGGGVVIVWNVATQQEGVLNLSVSLHSYILLTGLEDYERLWRSPKD